VANVNFSHIYYHPAAGSKSFKLRRFSDSLNTIKWMLEKMRKALQCMTWSDLFGVWQLFTRVTSWKSPFVWNASRQQWKKSRQQWRKLLFLLPVVKYSLNWKFSSCLILLFHHSQLYIEFCEGGALDSIMVDLEKPLTEAQIKYIGHEVCKGLEYLHSHKVIHRDMKAGNILLTLGGEVRLGKCYHSVVRSVYLSSLVCAIYCTHHGNDRT